MFLASPCNHGLPPTRRVPVQTPPGAHAPGTRLLPLGLGSGWLYSSLSYKFGTADPRHVHVCMFMHIGVPFVGSMAIMQLRQVSLSRQARARGHAESTRCLGVPSALVGSQSTMAGKPSPDQMLRSQRALDSAERQGAMDECMTALGLSPQVNGLVVAIRPCRLALTSCCGWPQTRCCSARSRRRPARMRKGAARA